MVFKDPLLFVPSAAVLPKQASVAKSPPTKISPRLSVAPPRKAPNIVPLIAFSGYATRLFVFPPVSEPLSSTFQEALDLSWNFCYIMPFLFPNLAATGRHPMFEAFFHIVVSWDFLLLGFAALDVTKPSDRPRATPFLFGSLFLTNIIYLPYLILRQSPGDDNASKDSTPLPIEKRSWLLSYTESSALPWTSVALIAVSILWALFARPEFGDFPTKLTSFASLTANQDILAYSLAADVLMYIFFQSALVDEDASCRQWTSEAIRQNAISVAKFVPLFGLVYYLLQRSRHAPLKWSSNSAKNK